MLLQRAWLPHMRKHENVKNGKEENVKRRKEENGKPLNRPALLERERDAARCPPSPIVQRRCPSLRCWVNHHKRLPCRNWHMARLVKRGIWEKGKIHFSEEKRDEWPLPCPEEHGVPLWEKVKI